MVMEKNGLDRFGNCTFIECDYAPNFFFSVDQAAGCDMGPTIRMGMLERCNS
jgi:hypothetical protein